MVSLICFFHLTLLNSQLRFSPTENDVILGTGANERRCSLDGDYTGFVICDPSTRVEETSKAGAPTEFLFKVKNVIISMECKLLNVSFKIQTDDEELIFCATTSANLIDWTKGLKDAVKGMFMTHDFFTTGYIHSLCVLFCLQTTFFRPHHWILIQDGPEGQEVGSALLPTRYSAQDIILL